MLQPKRTKFRKMHRGRRKGTAAGGSQVTFGDYGLKANAEAWITARQIEAARRAITRHFRRGGQVWIRVFPDKPITSQEIPLQSSTNMKRLHVATAIGIRRSFDENWSHLFAPQLLYTAFIKGHLLIVSEVHQDGLIH